MPRPAANADQMPAFKNAAEKREWLLRQLADVEREALLEGLAAGTNERITVVAGSSSRIDVGGVALHDGPDSVAFTAALSQVIQALPLGSVFIVEAGRGGKVLAGGSAMDQAPEVEQPGVSDGGKRRARKSTTV